MRGSPISESGEELRLRSQLQNNARMPPGHPLRVFVGVFIESMGNFQAAQMVQMDFDLKLKYFLIFESFDVDLYLYTNWRDPSLSHSLEKRPILIDDPRVRERIWFVQ